MYWEMLTSPEIEAIDKQTPVILPIAAIEQHGAHLPLATDRMIGAHFCNGLNDRIKDDVLILPSISVGCSEHHTDFPGSLSVQHKHLLDQMTDIADCVVKYGFKNIIVFNSHGGNIAIGQVFLERFGFRNPDTNVVMITWWKLVLEELKNLNETGKGGAGHAGEFETSLMLLIAPDLVKMHLAKARTNVPTFPWAEGDMLYGAQAGLYRSMKEMTGGGVFGEPRYSSKEQGSAITSLVVRALEKVINDLKND